MCLSAVEDANETAQFTDDADTDTAQIVDDTVVNDLSSVSISIVSKLSSFIGIFNGTFSSLSSFIGIKEVSCIILMLPKYLMLKYKNYCQIMGIKLSCI